MEYVLCSMQSANNLTVLWLSVARSLMYSRIKTGRRVDPCGTSEVTSQGDEDTPLTTTLCIRLLKNDVIHIRGLPFMP